jgi:putative sigma-54 modulation protein
MKLTITARGMDLSDAQRDHFEKKLARLDRFFDDDVEATARLRTERGLKIVEVTIPLYNDTLRAQEGTDELYASLDAVMEKMTRQIRKHRTRLEKRVRKGAYDKAQLEDAATIGAEEAENRLVRTKTFSVSPMSVEDAISSMEMLGHSFFIFLNDKTDSICVVYRRDDGNFGVLIPEK